MIYATIVYIIEKVVPEEHFSSSELSGQFGTESHTNSELMQWPSWQQKYPGSSTSGWRFNFLKVIINTKTLWKGDFPVQRFLISTFFSLHKLPRIYSYRHGSCWIQSCLKCIIKVVPYFPSCIVLGIKQHWSGVSCQLPVSTENVFAPYHLFSIDDLQISTYLS